MTRRPLLPLLVLAVATAWAVGGLLLPVHAGHARLRALRVVRRVLLRGRYPGVYATAFVLTAALELYGTRLGTWAWAPHDPTGLLSAANPPSGIPAATAGSTSGRSCSRPTCYRALVRARAALLRLRPAPAAPS